jgi:hypothetical protein
MGPCWELSFPIHFLTVVPLQIWTITLGGSDDGYQPLYDGLKMVQQQGTMADVAAGWILYVGELFQECIAAADCL